MERNDYTCTPTRSLHIHSNHIQQSLLLLYNKMCRAKFIFLYCKFQNHFSQNLPKLPKIHFWCILKLSRSNPEHFRRNLGPPGAFQEHMEPPRSSLGPYGHFYAFLPISTHFKASWRFPGRLWSLGGTIRRQWDAQKWVKMPIMPRGGPTADPVDLECPGRPKMLWKASGKL